MNLSAKTIRRRTLDLPLCSKTVEACKSTMTASSNFHEDEVWIMSNDGTHLPHQRANPPRKLSMDPNISPTRRGDRDYE
jgi:hypothetical protein